MLSLTQGTKIRIIEPGGLTVLKKVEEIGPSANAYDFFGNVFTMYIRQSEEPERRVVLGSSHGEPLLFGEKHRVLCRVYGGAAYVRVPIVDIKDAFVRGPQKKVYTDAGLFGSLDFDDEGMFLGAEKISDLFPLMERAATLGVTVNRHPTKKRAAISERRPICFASKLLNGNFEVDLEGTLEGLVTSGVVMPWKMYGPEVVAETIKTGIVFEGNCIFNELTLQKPRIMERPVTTYHVTFKEGMTDAQTPVELVWYTT